MTVDRLKQLEDKARRRPEDPQGWHDLGVAAFDAHQPEAARQALTESLHRGPDRMDTRIMLVRVLLDLGEDAAAKAEIDQGLRLDPRAVDLHLLGATFEERAGSLTEAARHLATIVATDVKNVQAFRRLGSVLGRLGDAAGSIRCWRHVVALTALGDLEALTALGIALSTEGQHAEAIQILSDVAARRGRVSSSHADLGMALLAAQRYPEAITAFSLARDLDAHSAQAYCGLGLVYQQQGRWWEAAEAFRRTEQLAPENPVGPMNLWVALQTLGEHEQARAALLRAAALAPYDEEIKKALEQIAAVPEPVQDEVTRPALRADQFEASIAGDLRSFDLFDVLEFLRRQRKSGSLVVSSRHGAGLVRLARGRVTSAAAPGVKRLGESLVERRLITPKQLEAALAQQRNDEEETLGSLLLRAGALDETRLADEVLRQIMTALEAIIRWTEGAFSFHAAEREDPEPPLSHDLQHVMMQLARTVDRRGSSPHRAT